ncbi:dienelactone hydrolase family protein [Sporosarcina siberiensis]|uniref:Dienelactone hydrolase family protein n=1 Tax=Sporosarcina siberiensis TaxID=1365606 RepID=A0ABW4SJR6_9BACL
MTTTKRDKTAVIVIHEIYGVNPHIEHFSESISKYDFDVICPDLLDVKIPFSYSQEELAYQNFMENVGFINASNKMKSLVTDVKKNYEKVFVIGFSVGATVSWLCSDLKGVQGIVAYYGSRIRDYIEVTPQCPALLFFPKEEKSFNVDELVSNLDYRNVELHTFNGQHGFADPYSPNYNKGSSEMAFQEMVSFLLKHSSMK